jgi:hypothetical protein
MAPDACREWRGSLATFALGSISDAEAIALRAHLDGCAACRAELDELSAVARLLPAADIDRVESTLVEPPDALADQVLAGVARGRANRRRRRWQRGLAGVAVAAVLALIVAVGAVLLHDDKDTFRTHLAFTGEGGGTATLIARPQGTEVDFEVWGLDEGDVYWLWLTDSGDRRVSAGTFRGVDGRTQMHLMAALPLERTQRVWVTDAEDHTVLDAWLDDSAPSTS